MACTDFMVKATDGTIVNGRSMDFGIEDQARLIVYPRGKQWASEAPGNKEGLKWEQRYGFVGFSVVGLDKSIDGMNEKGLIAKLLWLPSAGYQPVPKDKESAAMEVLLLPNWILGNFSTVAEVKNALHKVFVWGKEMAALGGGIPTMHLTVHDAEGNNIVAEWIDGKLNLYDNPLGVMTNDPPLPNHWANLRNFANLSSEMAKPLKLDGMTITGTGNGSGLLGLPGDCSPPSRFVRTAYLRAFAYQAKNSSEAVNLARHLLDQVTVIKGISREKTAQGEFADYTQWITIEDLTHRMIYISNYNDPIWRAVDLKKIDFTRGDYTPIEVAKPSGKAILDVTPR